jgi:hypothetical protein
MGINNPRILVICDLCPTEAEYGLTPLAGNGWDDRNLEQAMAKDGWTEDIHGTIRCALHGEQKRED